MEFYFRFRSRPVRRNLHIILHQHTEFRPNRNTHCGNMTSYPFLKMAAATAKYYFRFCMCWCHCFQNVKVYRQTKFCRDISIGGWDITTSGFEKQTSAILEFYFRFRSRPFCRNRRVILHRNIYCRNMTSYRFYSWRVPAMLYMLWGIGRPPTKCLSWSELGPQIACSSVNSSGDIAIYRFWLETAYSRPFLGVFGAYFPHLTSLIVLAPKRTVLGQKDVFWAIQRKNLCIGTTWAQDW